MRTPDGARCRECGYLLFALTECRCPECGTRFDPQRPETMDLPVPWARVRRFLRAVKRQSARAARSPEFQWPLLAVVATALVAVMPTRGLRFWENLLPTAFLTYGVGWSLWIYIVVAGWRAMRASTTRSIRYARWLVPLLLAVPASWTISWHGCPHTRVLYLGPLAARLVVIDGDPCGNARRDSAVLNRSPVPS